MKTEEIEKLAEKHGGTVIDYSLPEGPQTMDTTIIIATSELAALIAEVRRQGADVQSCVMAMETPGDIKGRFQSELYWRGVYALRDQLAIRARMEEGK